MYFNNTLKCLEQIIWQVSKKQKYAFAIWLIRLNRDNRFNQVIRSSRRPRSRESSPRRSSTPCRSPPPRWSGAGSPPRTAQGSTWVMRRFKCENNK